MKLILPLNYHTNFSQHFPIPLTTAFPITVERFCKFELFETVTKIKKILATKINHSVCFLMQISYESFRN
jgi:hypothetical protein